MSMNALNGNQFFNEQNTIAQSGVDPHLGYRRKTSNIYRTPFANGANNEVSSNPSPATANPDDE